ncbi:hypothetical protein JQ596_35340 [Bradyrhizobium manausense]|uniref:hypothetical protein n=1 Tax=Bradyrhizobium TaxID=374 RepID=UPI001BABA8F1|nr:MULTISPECIES: hypothetical protein [Bradyrhizobium]MBR0830792.1 hypothetical protein [Bradyrhizobium manausense]UVO28672.1 hypothetical protein KUF59_40565 [Bradyrhizobium arachidis]
MMVRSGNPVARPAMALCTLLSVLLGTAGRGWPQATAPSPSAPPALGLQEAGPQAPPQPVTSAPSAPPAREENPGLINEMGKLFDKLPSILPPIKSPGETAKDAGDALSRLAKPSVMISGRVSCPASPNGAPDCKAAADQLCQSKGYQEGKSLNADSAEKCSAKVLIPGRQRKPDDCRTDTYVTRALCQ